MKKVIFILFLCFSLSNSYSQDSVQVIISTCVTYDECDEWTGIQIVDSLNQQIIYDTAAIVTFSAGYRDTIYLQSPGIYNIHQYQVMGSGANICSPSVIVEQNHKVPAGLPVPGQWTIELPNTNGTGWTKWNGICCNCTYWGTNGQCSNQPADPCINFASIPDIEIKDFYIYPNPADNQITISTTEEHLGGILYLKDASGRTVKELEVQTTEQTLDINDLSPGVYNYTYRSRSDIIVIK